MTRNHLFASLAATLIAGFAVQAEAQYGAAPGVSGPARSATIDTALSNTFPLIPPTLPSGGPVPPEVVAATSVKSSKSNSSERQGQTTGAGDDPAPVEATNLNSSKSNVNRQVPQATAGGGPVPLEATTVKSGKSNSDFRQGQDTGAGDDSGSQETTTVKGSKSNSSDRGGWTGGY